MDRDEVRAYVERDWAAVERLDREYWADSHRRNADANFRIAAGLAEYVRRIRRDWPSELERQEDLDHHVTLERRIDRAAEALATR